MSESLRGARPAPLRESSVTHTARKKSRRQHGQPGGDQQSVAADRQAAPDLLADRRQPVTNRPKAQTRRYSHTPVRPVHAPVVDPLSPPSRHASCFLVLDPSKCRWLHGNSGLGTTCGLLHWSLKESSFEIFYWILQLIP